MDVYVANPKKHYESDFDLYAHLEPTEEGYQCTLSGELPEAYALQLEVSVLPESVPLQHTYIDVHRSGNSVSTEPFPIYRETKQRWHYAVNVAILYPDHEKGIGLVCGEGTIGWKFQSDHLPCIHGGLRLHMYSEIV